MEELLIRSEAAVEQEEQGFDRRFKPRGAIAFFLLLVALGAVIWFTIYFIMLSRI